MLQGNTIVLFPALLSAQWLKGNSSNGRTEKGPSVSVTVYHSAFETFDIKQRPGRGSLIPSSFGLPCHSKGRLTRKQEAVLQQSLNPFITTPTLDFTKFCMKLGLRHAACPCAATLRSFIYQRERNRCCVSQHSVLTGFMIVNIRNMLRKSACSWCMDLGNAIAG